MVALRYKAQGQRENSFLEIAYEIQDNYAGFGWPFSFSFSIIFSRRTANS
jgi:hypothetical protein